MTKNFSQLQTVQMLNCIYTEEWITATYIPTCIYKMCTLCFESFDTFDGVTCLCMNMKYMSVSTQPLYSADIGQCELLPWPWYYPQRPEGEALISCD